MVDESSIDRDETRVEIDPVAETHASETAGKDWLESNVGARGDEWIGKTVGQFEIIRLIGTGGMGNVYEAKQTHPHRIVALKIIRTVAATPAVLQRFTMESETLARLQHPGIAQVYDSGQQVHKGSPIPYFAMEYVVGSRSITEYSDEEHLNREGQLELFLRVCDAVQYGHGRGVIHRDLKPNNILITKAGRPKVIDYGVALMADADDEDKSVTLTGRFIGTLQWSSPEQCGDNPHDVDVRTDVYSLGVIMYQLIVGVLPYDLKGIPIFKVPAIVRETAPKPPRTLKPSIPIELDQIISKALAKERTSRYESVAEFAMDIRRFLNDEPIHAKSPSAWHRLCLYSRRNQLKFRAAVVVLLALLLGLTGLIWGFAESEARSREMRIALLEKEDARIHAEQKAYVATIGTAQVAIASESWSMAKYHLAATDREQRGWEWHYLHGMIDQSMRSWLIGDRPTTLATSSTGKYLAVTFEGGRVVLIDDERDLSRDVALPSKVQAIDFSLDGLVLLMGMEDGQVALLDLTQDSLSIIGLSGKSIEKITAVNDGGFATGHADGTILFWSSTGEIIQDLNSNSGLVLTLAFDAKQNRLAIGTVDGTIQVWNTLDYKLLLRNHTHNGTAHAVTFLPDGILVSVGADDKIVFWDVEKNSEVATWTGGHGGMLGLATDGNLLTTVGLDGVVRLWSLETNELINALRGHDDLIWAVGELKDDVFVSVGQDGSIRWWSTLHPEFNSLKVASSMPASDVAFVWNETLAIVSEFDSNLQVVDVPSGVSRVLESGSDQEMSTVVFIPRSSIVVTGGVEGEIRLWDVESDQPSQLLGSCNGQVSALDGSSKGNYIAAGTFAGHVSVWNSKDQTKLFEKLFDESIVLALTFDTSGQVLFVSTSNGRLTALNVQTGDANWSRIGNGTDVVGMAYAQQRDAVLTVTLSNTIQLLEATTGKVMESSVVTGAPLRDIVTFPSGSRFVTAHADGTIGIWDVENFGPIAMFPAAKTIECIDVSSDGYRLAVGGGAGKVHLLDGMSHGARHVNTTK